MKRTLAGLACIFGAACADEVYEFDPPRLEDAKSLIFIFELRAPRAFAIDTADQTQTVALKFDGGEVPVYALLYDRTLTELDLIPGELGLVNEGRALPESPRPIQKAVVGNGVKRPWADVALPQFIEDLRIVGGTPDPCENAPRFMLETHELETKTNGRDVIDNGDGTAMITTFDGSFYRIGPGIFERMQLAPNLPSLAVYRAPDGALWFAGKNGAIAETQNGTVIARTLTAPSGGDVQRLAGPTDSNVQFEMLLLDFGTGSLLRFDGNTFTELTRDHELLIGDVAWTGSRAGLAVLGTRTSLTVIDGDQTSQEDVGLGNIGVGSLAIHPELGAFIGTVNGRLLRKVNGAWTDLGDLGANVDSVAPYGEGVVLGGVNGFFGYWSESTGLCAQQLLPENVEKVFPIGDDIAVTMLNDNWEEPILGMQPTYATWMRRMR